VGCTNYGTAVVDPVNHMAYFGMEPQGKFGGVVQERMFGK
jgi:hypothetical protein